MNKANAGRAGPRILLCPYEIAGYYVGLEAGLRDLGINALAIDLGGHPFGYRRVSGEPPILVRLAQRAYAGERATRLSRLLRPWWRLARIATSLLVLLWAVGRFDVFVFSCGNSFLGLRELPLLRRLGKRMVFVFHGTDARPPYISGDQMSPDGRMSISDCQTLTRTKKATIRWIERYADAIIAQPAFSHFFERPVVDFFVVGMPWMDPPAVGQRDSDNAPLRILHSPSNPMLKGSARIRESIERLQSEGLNLELVELRGVSNDIVLREIASCDFVIDQIYSDAPMVGFATEAAVAGKPAVVGGYVWPEYHRIFGLERMPPVEECTPETVADAIRQLAMNRPYREALGARARDFVRNRWSRTAIAERLLMIVAGSVPTEWLFDPRDQRYLEGCGLTREQARANVAAMVSVGGAAALCVSDKPELEQRFLAFASDSLDPGATERP